MRNQANNLNDYRRIVLEDFGEEALQSIGKSVKDAYYESYSSCYEAYKHSEAHDLLPFKRRVDIHNKIRQALEPYAGIQVTVEPNEFNATHHLRLTTARVLLDVAKVRTPGEMVPATRYRDRYAQDNQLDLFRSDEEETPSNRLSAALLHGYDPSRRQYLAFLQIVFPDKRFERYVGTSIDLMQLCPELSLISEPEPIAQEDTAKQPLIRLKAD